MRCRQLPNRLYSTSIMLPFSNHYPPFPILISRSDAGQRVLLLSSECPEGKEAISPDFRPSVRLERDWRLSTFFCRRDSFCQTLPSTSTKKSSPLFRTSSFVISKCVRVFNRFGGNRFKWQRCFAMPHCICDVAYVLFATGACYE